MLSTVSVFSSLGKRFLQLACGVLVQVSPVWKWFEIQHPKCVGEYPQEEHSVHFRDVHLEVHGEVYIPFWHPRTPISVCCLTMGKERNSRGTIGL